MALMPAPARTEISDTYPNPSNAVARTGFGKLWDFVTSLLGTTGATGAMLAASKILDPTALYNYSLVPSVAANALTMTLKSADGTTALASDNAAIVSQRSVTAGSGLFLSRPITAAISLVISSGSTLGHLSAIAGDIYWYIIDNAGTQELAASTKDFGLTGIVSTTAEGGAGAADSATVMYSVTARSNVPFRFIGKSTDTQTTAGTWTAVPTSIVLPPFDVKAVGKNAISIPVTALTPRSANGCAPLTTTNGAANQPDIPYLAFDGAAKEYAGFNVRMPKSWDEGTVTVSFAWRRASGIGAANVVLGLRAVAVSDNDTPIATFGSDATVTDAASTTTANMNISAETGACTIAGSPAEGDLVFFEVFRDGAAVGDTLDAVDVWLTEVTLFITTNEVNDA